MIAITGGIGSGKSIVSQLLRVMGYSVYDCDAEGKRLMQEDPELRQQLVEAFGSETYDSEGNLNRKYLAACIFGHPEQIERMNRIVHPAVGRDLLRRQPDFFESAILFESGFVDLSHPKQIWCVSAPLDLRIQRATKRDGSSREQILSRIASQMPQEEKERLSDVVIVNDAEHSLIEQLRVLLPRI